jgi:hypothetical protein
MHCGIVSLLLCAAGITAAQAPYPTIAAAAAGASALVAVLDEQGAAASLAHARRESHLDDPRVQRSLDAVSATLPALRAGIGEVRTSELVATDRFASSFVRFTWLLRGSSGELRVMFTYRRKTNGWRLNQYYAD